MTSPLSSTSRVLIIGASHSGVAMAENLRRLKFQGQITIIDREPNLPMERPPLSKAWLINPDTTSNQKLRQPEWYQDNNIELVLGAEVISANQEAKTATLKNGEIYQWDELVLATGAVPRPLPPSLFTDGSNAATSDERIHVLRVPSDAKTLSQAMTKGKNLVIIGGGYIGLEVAASAKKRGLKVSVVEMAERLLARVASPEVSEYFHNLHEEHGVSIYTNQGLKAIDTSGNTLKLDIGGGEILEADLVVAGIGVVPELSLADSLGLEVGNGFLVNGHYQTELDCVWAIGDVALSDGGYTRGAMRIESVHHAQMSAEIAASAMMGIEPKPHEVPWFWSEQYDKKLQSAGLVSAGSQTVSRLGRREGAVSFWSFSGGVLQAVEAIGDVQAYMIGKTLLTTKASITPEQIADPDLDLKTLI